MNNPTNWDYDGFGNGMTVEDFEAWDAKAIEGWQEGEIEALVEAVIEMEEKETARALYFERLVQRLAEAIK